MSEKGNDPVHAGAQYTTAWELSEAGIVMQNMTQRESLFKII